MSQMRVHNLLVLSSRLLLRPEATNLVNLWKFSKCLDAMELLKPLAVKVRKL